MLEEFSVSGRKILISGASRGIGLNLCNRLAELGAHIIGISRSSRPSELLGKIDYFQTDINENSQVEQLREKIYSKYQNLDGLINVAGISLGTEVDVSSEITRFKKTVESNLSSVYSLTQILLPLFVDKGGSIVNFSSINSQIGFPDNPGYVASKSGLSGLTRALAIDYAKFKIRVNSIAPGYFHTAMTKASFNDPVKHKIRSEKTILGRWGDLDDLVGPTIFLVTDMSKYITGIEITVDGGWTAKGM